MRVVPIRQQLRPLQKRYEVIVGTKRPQGVQPVGNELTGDRRKVWRCGTDHSTPLAIIEYTGIEAFASCAPGRRLRIFVTLAVSLKMGARRQFVSKAPPAQGCCARVHGTCKRKNALSEQGAGHIPSSLANAAPHNSSIRTVSKHTRWLSSVLIAPSKRVIRSARIDGPPQDFATIRAVQPDAVQARGKDMHPKRVISGVKHLRRSLSCLECAGTGEVCNLCGRGGVEAGALPDTGGLECVIDLASASGLACLWA